MGQRFLLDDLTTRLGHPDSSLHSSAVKCKRQTEYSLHVWSCAPNIPALVTHSDSLTFQILVLLAHRPRADLVVDHVDALQAAPETGLNMSVVNCVPAVLTQSDQVRLKHYIWILQDHVMYPIKL